MSADPTFRMTIEDVFGIRGRGTVVTGKIERGTLKVDDEIQIERQGATIKRVIVTGIEMSRKVLAQARAGDNVGVLLRGVERTEIQSGDVLVGVAPTFGLNL